MALTLYFSHPDYSTHYQAEALNDKDKARVAKHPALSDNLSWQNSRALKKHVALQSDNQYCLSHKNNYALIGSYPGKKIGVDLEQVVEKNIDGIIRFIGNPAEIEYLNSKSKKPYFDFYRIWTVKESLIKAENLRFPTDMKAVGFSGFADNWLIKNAGKNYQWLSIGINHKWLMSAVIPECDYKEINVNLYAFLFNDIEITFIESSFQSVNLNLIKRPE